jgi:hypothetical protein
LQDAYKSRGRFSGFITPAQVFTDRNQPDTEREHPLPKPTLPKLRLAYLTISSDFTPDISTALFNKKGLMPVVHLDSFQKLQHLFVISKIIILIN